MRSCPLVALLLIASGAFARPASASGFFAFGGGSVVAENAGIHAGVGVEGGNRPLRAYAAASIHVLPENVYPDAVPAVMVGLRLVVAGSTQRLRPYLRAGLGYGAMPEGSDFIPSAGETAIGIEFGDGPMFVEIGNFGRLGMDVPIRVFRVGFGPPRVAS